jgi:hypothetical protein
MKCAQELMMCAAVYAAVFAAVWMVPPKQRCTDGVCERAHKNDGFVGEYLARFDTFFYGVMLPVTKAGMWMMQPIARPYLWLLNESHRVGRAIMGKNETCIHTPCPGI